MDRQLTSQTSFEFTLPEPDLVPQKSDSDHDKLNSTPNFNIFSRSNTIDEQIPFTTDVPSIDQILNSRASLVDIDPKGYTRPGREKRLSHFLMSLSPVASKSQIRDPSPSSCPVRRSNTLESEISLLDNDHEFLTESDSSSDEEDDSQDFSKTPDSESEARIADAEKALRSQFSTSNERNKKIPTLSRGKSFTKTVGSYLQKFKGIVGGFIKRTSYEVLPDFDNKTDSQVENLPPHLFKTVVSGRQEKSKSSENILEGIFLDACKMERAVRSLAELLKKLETPSFNNIPEPTTEEEKSEPTLESLTASINKHRREFMQRLPALTQKLRQMYHIWVHDLVELEKISEGPYGDVTRVFDKHKKEFYALKRLKHVPGWSETSFELQAMRELEIYVTLFMNRDPDLLNLYALEYDPELNEYALVLELGSGNLKNYVEMMVDYKIQFGQASALGLISQLLKQITKLKALSIYHRDIKPENVIITNNSSIKLSYFDSAYKIEGTIPNRLEITGTPYYMPNELRTAFEKGESEASFDPYKADIYSIAATMAVILINSKKLPEDLLQDIPIRYGVEIGEIIDEMMMLRTFPSNLNEAPFIEFLTTHQPHYDEYFRRKLLKRFINEDRLLQQRRLLKVGLFKNAEEYMKENLEHSIQWGTPNDVIRAKLNLAQVYKEQKRIADCFQVLKEVKGKIPRQEKMLNIYRLSIKAELYASEDRTVKALHEYRKMKTLYKKYFNDKDEFMAKLYMNIGSIYKIEKRYTKAFKYFTKALQIYSSKNERHPEIGSVCEHVGLMYEYLGKQKDAMKYYERALRRSIAAFGEFHPKVGLIYGRMGTSYSKQKNYSAALNYQKKALEININFSGPHSRDAAGTYGHIATIYRHQKKYKEAFHNYFNAIEIYLNYGQDQKEIAILCEHVGHMYEEFQKYDEALSYFRKALEVKRALHGDIHPEISQAFCQLASIYKKMGKHADCIQNYTNALEIDSRIYGETHPRIGKLHYKLGGVYQDKKDYPRAMKNFLQAMEIFMMHYTEHKYELARTYSFIARVYELQENYDDAYINYVESLNIFRKKLGDDALEIAVVHSRIGAVYEQQGNLEKAIEHLMKTLELYKKIYGEKHEKVEKYYVKVGELLEQSGEKAKALRSYKKSLSIRIQKMAHMKNVKARKFVSHDWM